MPETHYRRLQRWAFYLLLCTMVILVARVRCGWNTVKKQARCYGRDSTFPCTNAFVYPSRARMLGPSSRLFAKWSVGDSVLVNIDNLRVSGVIQEARGSGWFTVQPTNATSRGTLLKCRSTQLSNPDDSSQLVGPTLETLPPDSLMFSAPNPMRPLIHPDAGKKPDFPPPPPTIHDLDAMLLDRSNITNRRDQEFMEQLAHHSKYKKWVVFTDLHCSPSSLATCLEVLTKVHDLAVTRNAGILFLGDFWHHRGTLRVDCLNSILEHFRDWTVPMVMIPGNHDQVTLDGHNHGLIPFENAYRVGNVSGPLIFSHPTKFREALFVPHIRNVATMESILQSSLAQEASALFVHADVTGAMMNDLVVSKDGIPPASFPVQRLIYSGHFHKPHTVRTTNGLVAVEYLGSPYETSLSEAQQIKSLAILDADWKCIDYVPIDIGRRHFKVSSWVDLSNLKFHSQNELDHSIVRAGDRVVASIPQEAIEKQTSDVNMHIKALRTGGVMVEVREIKVAVDQAMGSSEAGGAADKLEEMSPESTWRAYITEEEERKKLNADSASLSLTIGLDILREIEASEETKWHQSKTMTDLTLTKVSVEGFGPFREKVIYPLWSRGLVLLKGTNNDVGSDSNGSGKSSLAMAALWALTGSMDPRRAQDGKVSDVVNDEAKVARVTLDGTLNGLPFSIARTKTASKSSLIFQLNGEDLTTQSVKETQALIEEHLGITDSMLSRTMFHGQHAINDLLEATDAKLKEELSLLVPLELWQTAASTSRSKSREAAKRAAEFDGMITMRSQDLKRLDGKRKQAEDIVNQKQRRVSTLEDNLKQQESLSNQHTMQVDFQELESTTNTLSIELADLDDKFRQLMLEKDSALAPLLEEVQSAHSIYESILKVVRQDERDEYAATLTLKMAMDRIVNMEEKWSVDLEGGASNLSIPDVCPTCRQRVTGNEHDHSQEDFAMRMKGEIDDGITKRDIAKRTLEEVSSRLEIRRLDLQSQDEKRISLERDLAKMQLEWMDEIKLIKKSIEEKQSERNNFSERMAAAARNSQIATKNEADMASLKMERVWLQHAEDSLLSIDEEVKEIQAQLDEMIGQKDSQRIRAKTMSELADLFGQRGVQTFVLQNVVDLLQTCSQTYLDDLSDGSQRMNLALDAGDRISRTAYVIGSDGVYRERPLATLSGGQWRRCSLALTFGFAELIARRGKFRPSMCVLDEPLTHLDRSGRTKVGEVIRKMLRPTDSDGMKGFGVMGMSTVLIILQDLAAEELDEAFDCIDEVIKENSSSRVKVDGFTLP